MTEVKKIDMNEKEALIWIAELFEEPVCNINPETSKKDIAAWDSLGVLVLMAALDEQYGIVMSENEIEGIKKVGDIQDLLRKHGHLS